VAGGKIAITLVVAPIPAFAGKLNSARSSGTALKAARAGLIVRTFSFHRCIVSVLAPVSLRPNPVGTSC